MIKNVGDRWYNKRQYNFYELKMPTASDLIDFIANMSLFRNDENINLGPLKNMI